MPWSGQKKKRINSSPNSMCPPAGEGDGVSRAQKYKLIPHLTLFAFSLFPWVNAGAAVATSSTWKLCEASWLGVCGGASWCLGGDEDEELFPYCVNEYLCD
uniref:Uncharacterized protein n=2 Tax=Sus scrofa TaxID=9823 RepID=A0A4X1VRF6_PIG